MRKEKINIIYITGNMNFHIFVAIITCVFYVFLRIYKSKVQNDNKTKSKSNFIYILFIPIILYITHFLYYNEINNDLQSSPAQQIEKHNSLQISEDLLSIPYPESSFRSSNLN
jgi:heme/copper-type cytochrome/quinol oxidase subunit 2